MDRPLTRSSFGQRASDEGVAMRLGRIGGLLIITSSVAFAAASAVATTGGSVSVRGAGLGGLFVTIAFALLGAGAGLLALGGLAGSGARLARVGLGLMAIALTVSVATPVAASDSVFVIVFLAAGMVAALGAILTVLGLLLTPGPARRSGVLFLGGALLALVAQALANLGRPGSGGSSPAILDLAAGAVTLMCVVVLVAALVSLGRIGLQQPRLETVSL